MGCSSRGEDHSKMAELSKTLKEGERIVAPSRRPDGTLRKPIRIRAGYVPQEEVAIYQSKGALVCHRLAFASPPPRPLIRIPRALELRVLACSPTVRVRSRSARFDRARASDAVFFSFPLEVLRVKSGEVRSTEGSNVRVVDRRRRIRQLHNRFCIHQSYG